MGHPRRAGLVKALVSGLLIAGAAFLIATFDPFGVESNSSKFSADMAQYIGSPFYARGLGARAPVAQQRITVVYLDEAGLERLRGLWKGYPPSFVENAQLVQDVASGAGVDIRGEEQGRPRAIFVDFVFLSKGRNPDEFRQFSQALGGLTRSQSWAGLAACSNDELIKLACIRASGGLPIILGGDKSTPSTPSQDAAPELLANAVLANVTVSERSYPLLGPEDGSDSPAALLYAADCLTDPNGCHPREAFVALAEAAGKLVSGEADAGPRAAEAAHRIRHALRGRFAVSWSAEQPAGASGAATLQAAIFGKPQHCRGDEVEHPGLHAWVDAVRRVGERLTPWRLTRREGDLEDAEAREAERVCTYALSLPYGYFVNGPPLSAAFRARLFTDKLVLVGGQFNNSNDWVNSPVHGQAPGVQYHAMALDNLLEDKSRGHAPPRIDRWTETLSHAFSAALILLMVFLGGVHRIERNDRSRRVEALQLHGARRIRAAVGFMLMYLRFLVTDALIIVVGVFLAVQAHVPMNWIGVAAIVLGHGLWSVREVILEDIRPLFERWPTSRALRWMSVGLSLENEVLHVRGSKTRARKSASVSARHSEPPEMVP